MYLWQKFTLGGAKKNENFFFSQYLNFSKSYYQILLLVFFPLLNNDIPFNHVQDFEQRKPCTAPIFKIKHKIKRVLN